MQRRHFGDISQPQADALITPGKLRLGLGKAVQDTLARFRRNSDPGVRYFDQQRRIAQADLYRHRAPGRREFDGIGDQMSDGLGEPFTVPVKGGQVLGNGRLKGQPCCPSARLALGHQRRHTVGQIDQFAAGLLVARLHLGEIQNVIDQVQQAVAVGENLAGIFVLPRGRTFRAAQ